MKTGYLSRLILSRLILYQEYGKSNTFVKTLFFVIFIFVLPSRSIALVICVHFFDNIIMISIQYETQNNVTLCLQLGDYNQVVDSYGAALEKVPECERETDDFEKLQQNLAEFYVDLGLFTAARSAEKWREMCSVFLFQIFLIRHMSNFDKEFF